MSLPLSLRRFLQLSDPVAGSLSYFHNPSSDKPSEDPSKVLRIDGVTLRFDHPSEFLFDIVGFKQALDTSALNDVSGPVAIQNSIVI